MRVRYILFIISLIFCCCGCSKRWIDVNNNPNSLSDAPPNFTFAVAANRIAAFVAPNELGSYWAGHWSQSNSFVLSQDIFAYKFNAGFYNQIWNNNYDILEDLQYTIDNPVAGEMPFFTGAARILKAYVFQILVDTYGNLPYRDALKGSASLTPKFDDQKFIYEDLLKTIDTAINIIRANQLQSAVASSDILFGSNISLAQTRWIQFAQSLKLRMLMRQSRIPGREEYIKTEINKMTATNEGFLPVGIDVTSNPGYLASGGKMNPFYEIYGYSATGVATTSGRYSKPTSYLLNSLKSARDTFRMKRLAWPRGGEGIFAQMSSNYIGIPFGAPSGYLAQSTSYIGPSQIKKGEMTRPMIWMTNAELQFLLAEAKQVYGAAVNLPQSAQFYYEQGVRESFRVTGTTASYGLAPVDALLSSGQNLSDWSASPNKLMAIWMQKWIAMVHYNGFEAWAEYRRTNFPVTPSSLAAPSNTLRPLRLHYPLSELQSNAINVLAQGTIDPFVTRLFWDVD